MGNVNYNGKALWGTNFVGPGPNSNPYRLGLSPLDAIDGAAQRHDWVYWKVGAEGGEAAFGNMNPSLIGN